jgi:hypothetical protein
VRSGVGEVVWAEGESGTSEQVATSIVRSVTQLRNTNSYCVTAGFRLIQVHQCGEGFREVGPRTPVGLRSPRCERCPGQPTSTRERFCCEAMSVARCPAVMISSSSTSSRRIQNLRLREDYLSEAGVQGVLRNQVDGSS